MTTLIPPPTGVRVDATDGRLMVVLAGSSQSGITRRCPTRIISVLATTGFAKRKSASVTSRRSAMRNNESPATTTYSHSGRGVAVSPMTDEMLLPAKSVGVMRGSLVGDSVGVLSALGPIGTLGVKTSGVAVGVKVGCGVTVNVGVDVKVTVGVRVGVLVGNSLNRGVGVPSVTANGILNASVAVAVGVFNSPIGVMVAVSVVVGGDVTVGVSVAGINGKSSNVAVAVSVGFSATTIGVSSSVGSASGVTSGVISTV